ADDAAVRTSIGAILLLMAGVTVWRRRAAGKADEAGKAEKAGEGQGSARLKAGSYGVLGGFTTMVANAGGPVMSMYLLSAGFRKLGFLGTSAWFFLIVNVAKVPFSVGLGLIDGHSLLLDAALVLFVIPGAFLGKAIVGRINQRLFERLVIAATVVGGAQLLLR
ncbi:TSUP family transporter, partial [Streptomyces sp. 2MCAF27]